MPVVGASLGAMREPVDADQPRNPDDDDDESDSDFVPESSEDEEEGEEEEGRELSSEESGDEDEAELVNNIPFKIKEIQDQLQQQNLLEQSEERQIQFISKYRRYLSPQTEAVQKLVPIENRNFLYRMASGWEWENTRALWLVKSLASKFPKLLYEADDANRGALLVAVIKERRDFIKAVLESDVEQFHFNKALASSGYNYENCIHLAVISKGPKRLSSQVIIQLIEKASEETLAAKDLRGLTPLHRAVDYARCTRSQVDIVKALISRGDKAFDELTGEPDLFSPYRYHFDSRRRFEKEESQRIEKKKVTSSKSLDKAKRVTTPTPPRAPLEALPGSAHPSRPEGDLKVSSEKDRTAAVKKANHDLYQRNGWDKAKRDENLDSKGRDGKVGGENLKDTTKAKLADDSSSRFPEPSPGFIQKLTRAPTTDFGRIPPSHLPYQANEARQQVSSDVARHMVTLVAGPPLVSVGSADRGAPDADVSVKPKRPKIATTHSRTARSSKTSWNSAETPSLEFADAIAKELKLHYLRTTFEPRAEAGSAKADNPTGTNKRQTPRTHNCAIAFLFGENKEDNNICFDFPPTPSKRVERINFTDFEASYRGLVFDEVLRYVDFRRVMLDTAVVRQRHSEAAADSGAGRKDMVKFFDWLHEKNVRNIIKVIVEDRAFEDKGTSQANDEKWTPHSDEAIEQALKRFDVEILDWRKVDLDPKTIWDAGRDSNLRELHLWWSGNNAILRSWSEPDGLVKLGNLNKIELHQAQNGLESASRTKTNIEEFKTRLQNGRDALGLGSICVEYHKPGNLLKSRPKGHTQTKEFDGRRQIDTHRWLTIMDTFADGISRLGPPPGFPSDYLKHESLPEELRRDVKVALLDDGANFMHRAIAGQLQNGRSFDSGYENPDLSGAPGPFHGSTTGHGTYMAYMIGRVCPPVKIFVCKMNVIRQEGGEKARFTARSAADAVEFAVNRKFDIISMSWTVQRIEDDRENNTADINRLEAALERAVKAKILIFCSAPDIGVASNQVLGLYYPFGLPTISESIFKIGAAKADGSMYGLAGNQSSVDFILPGHNVELREGDKIQEEDDIPKTGSSIATALAAGLAALIISCVRLGAIYNWHRKRSADSNAVSVDSLRAVKQFAAMKEALVRVSAGYTEKDRRLEVEGFFRDPSKLLDMDSVYSTEQKWEKITQLARDLVSSSTQARAAQF
ncbi:hypothetical protein B0H67DRAFT_178559 [Lasiosphaeris hirsuta]|uniref:Peptidase S8/S53 domain-containing protein n=1 Tax=Lasiosphaeris hirsuta TaxID=260670 RepID=A0AA40E0W0_9PEZI|nr:hypothetical protein B0H67DRAFT_178559 [Lasiosphaeris hirsuta]